MIRNKPIGLRPVYSDISRPRLFKCPHKRVLQYFHNLYTQIPPRCLQGSREIPRPIENLKRYQQPHRKHRKLTHLSSRHLFRQPEITIIKLCRTGDRRIYPVPFRRPVGLSPNRFGNGRPAVPKNPIKRYDVGMPLCGPKYLVWHRRFFRRRARLFRSALLRKSSGFRSF